MAKVWVLTIPHSDGCYVAACASEEIARQQLFGYVRDWWEIEMGEEEPIPADPQEAIDLYFDTVEGEEGWISEEEIRETVCDEVFCNR